MKVIDLLNKIANEELEDKTIIEYGKTKYMFRINYAGIWDIKTNEVSLLDNLLANGLNDEIKTMETENNIITKIEGYCKRGLLKYKSKNNLPEASYYMGYHDMGGEILEIIKERKGE